MEIVKLDEPHPRQQEIRYDAPRYPTDSLDYLPIPEELPSVSFFKVLERRNSRRSFGGLTKRDLGILLWSVGKTRLQQREPSGFVWERRGTPSAGGRHPIMMLVISPICDQATLQLYDPVAHALSRLSVDSLVVEAFRKGLQDILPSGDGTLIWLAGDYERTGSKYHHPESLVWRDGGAVISTLHLVAEALGLNCCAYGVHGDDWIERVIGHPHIGGMGGCVIGSRP